MRDRTMAKSKRKRRDISDFDSVDDFGHLDGEEFDLEELSRDIYSTEWSDDVSLSGDRLTARRRIERRREMHKLYSELDEWDSFGDRPDG